MYDSEEILSRRGKIIFSKPTLSQEVKKSISLLFFTLISIIVTVSIAYLTDNAQRYQKGHVFTSEQIKNAELEDESDLLLNKIISVKSYKNIEENPIVKSMSKPETIIYLN